jgi:hypothetical protein
VQTAAVPGTIRIEKTSQPPPYWPRRLLSSYSTIDWFPLLRPASLVLGGVGNSIYEWRSFRSCFFFRSILDIFSLGHCEENYPCNICPGCYVLKNGDSYWQGLTRQMS